FVVSIRTCHPAVVETVLHFEIHDRDTSADAVEVIREALRFDQGFPAAIRASRKIAVTRGSAVITGNQRLHGQRRHMYAAAGKLGALLGVGARPAAAHRLALVSHVGGGDRQVAVWIGPAARGMVDADLHDAAKSAATDLYVALRPALDR